jgi:hypothetical protein
MNKILVDGHYLPYLIDEELYVVEDNFKQQVTESKEHLASTEEDNSNVALPNLVKDLLLIVRFGQDSDSIASYKTFLSKLLAAAGYRLQNVDLVVMNKFKDTKAKTIIENSQAKFVMAFGVDLKNPDNFQVRQYAGKHIIISAPLETLPSDRAKKTKLWGLMKEMFKLE